MNLKIKLFSLLLLFTIHSYCQTAVKSTRYFEKNPVWIPMMADTLTNYFEATKAFETYWSIRPIPVEEEDIIGHTEEKQEIHKSRLSRIFMTKKERKEEDSEKYAFQYKKFLNWKRAMLPYVQEDGKILTPSQRIEIWKAKKSNK